MLARRRQQRAASALFGGAGNEVMTDGSGEAIAD